ncbi:tyrosine-type recombinase/integrase [Rhodococcus ruber]|uniref:tyrosine-type recombinase/integrase n=1 Tax=Rhodococcus ruber TaxID=1830 RepID=UPI00387DC50A
MPDEVAVHDSAATRAAPVAGAIGHIVGTACRTAGLARIGAHRLRHSLATEMLRAGASLPEVGQVLRHRNARSTAIYAKVDELSLRPLARPWPGTTVEATGPDTMARSMVRPWPEARS